MEVIPAIDIRGGKCVRLYQGDYDRETVFSDSPARIAAHWASEGASRIHIVDLDGAKAGAPVHAELVAGIAESVVVSIQFGGGIKTIEAARLMASSGVGRIVIGTAAVEDASLVEQASRELGAESVVVSVDAVGGYVAVRGWTESSELPATELVERIEGMGVQRFVYTDITRDGTLTEPNFEAIEQMAGQTDMKMLVAGGVSSVDHLQSLARIGVEAAIIGTAVYTGDIDLRDAIDALGGSATTTNKE